MKNYFLMLLATLLIILLPMPALQAAEEQSKITTEQLAKMLVNELGYDELAQAITYLGPSGYITIAEDFGFFDHLTGNGKFDPKAIVTKNQIDTAIAKQQEALNREIDFKNGFYAISSSSQMNAIEDFNSISFGWARIELDKNVVKINTTSKNRNEYNIPIGYEKPLLLAEEKMKMLMLAVDDKTAADIINDAQLRIQAVNEIASSVDNIEDKDGNSLYFDGVVVDFEGLKGEETRDKFVLFLTSLREALDKSDKKMFVAVHPKRRTGHEYFNGYDYKKIGVLADKVILMAHDYNTRLLTESQMQRGIVMTPLAPIEEIYYSLREITNAETGVEDRSKIVLQISFNTAQWKMRDGSVINSKPFTPAYNALIKRMNAGAQIKYSKKHESPYITFVNSDDKTDNVIWYEDSRSVEAKVRLAKMFGITGISIWRLGTVPNGNEGFFLNVLEQM